MESLAAQVLDGAGGARALDREALRRWTPRDGALWVRVDPESGEGRQWLIDDSGLPAGDSDALLRRPVRQTRVEVIDGGALLVSLRIFAPETGEPLEVRCLVRADRLITVSSDAFPAFEVCRERLDAGRGPKTAVGVVLTALRAAAEIDQMAAIRLDQQVAELEGSAERDLGRALEPLRDTWQRGTALRRRLGAQREALVQLKQRGPDWLLATRPDVWRDALASSGELAETVDDALDRLRALQEYTQNRLSSVLNDRLYLLTILSAIMLPLSFITSLLGVNVGGVPARDTPWAFAALCALLALLAVGEYLLLRRLRWVPSSPGGPRR